MRTVRLKAAQSEGTGIAVSSRRADASRTLASNGRWVVPPEERPAGWQSVGLGEEPDNVCIAGAGAARATGAVEGDTQVAASNPMREAARLPNPHETPMEIQGQPQARTPEPGR